MVPRLAELRHYLYQETTSSSIHDGPGVNRIKTTQNMTALADQSEVGDADERVYRNSVFAALNATDEVVAAKRLLRMSRKLSFRGRNL